MDKTSTPVNKKTVKREKPSKKVIENILNYSASLSMIIGLSETPFLVINN